MPSGRRFGAGNETRTRDPNLGKENKIRLAGIDCPERKQPWGQRAKQALSGYVFDDVTVEWSKLDRYKRIVGKILDGERDVNLALVRDGMCWWYKKYTAERGQVDQTLYEAAETKAKTDRAGLWSDPDPVPPWELASALISRQAQREIISRNWRPVTG